MCKFSFNQCTCKYSTVNFFFSSLRTKLYLEGAIIAEQILSILLCYVPIHVIYLLKHPLIPLSPYSCSFLFGTTSGDRKQLVCHHFLVEFLCNPFHVGTEYRDLETLYCWLRGLNCFVYFGHSVQCIFGPMILLCFFISLHGNLCPLHVY